jgi:hypothetical protein
MERLQSAYAEFEICHVLLTCPKCDNRRFFVTDIVSLVRSGAELISYQLECPLCEHLFVRGPLENPRSTAIA